MCSNRAIYIHYVRGHKKKTIFFSIGGVYFFAALVDFLPLFGRGVDRYRVTSLPCPFEPVKLLHAVQTAYVVADFPSRSNPLYIIELFCVLVTVLKYLTP